MRKFRKHRKHIKPTNLFSYEFGFSNRYCWFGKKCTNEKSYYEVGVNVPFLRNAILRRLKFKKKPSKLLMNPYTLFVIALIWSFLVWILIFFFGIILFFYEAIIEDFKKALKEIEWKPNYTKGFFLWMITAIVFIFMYIFK